MAEEPGQSDPKVVETHGPLYWFLRNTREGFTTWYRRHWIKATGVLLAILALIFLLRAFIHPYVIIARQRSFLIALVLLLAISWYGTRRRRTLVKGLVRLVTIILLIAIVLWGGAAHDYMAQYSRYRTLNIVELDKLPLTGYERVQPLNSIFSLAHERISETESAQRPDFVRVDGEYKWTLAIEPAYAVSRLTGKVEKAVSIPGDDPTPNFTKREQVQFEVGEGMLFGRNSRMAIIKSMNPWRFFHYEPSEVRYLKDDQGQWVQVVSLVRWDGIFFPRPEFGGVQVIRQEQLGIWGDVRLLLFGAGEWIPPEDVHKHKYLLGQNILSYDVSRYMARALRFQSGFMGPMPWRHEGDVKIPNLSADINDQPFTTYFEEVADRSGMLFHYFGLEPYDPNKQALTVSVFIPADGSGPVYVYNHFERGEALSGVSAITAKIMDTKKEYDWTRHRPVEHRPFIHDIAGKRRFFWLTTIVTYKDDVKKIKDQIAADEQHEWFIAGTRPNIVITDAALNVPVWVISFDPTQWSKEVSDELTKWGLGK
jgi:hypothetical protein